VPGEGNPPTEGARGAVSIRSSKEKLEAVAEEVRDARRDQRPVLIGTTSVKESERLSALLDAREILQETFLKVYDNLEKFRGEAHLSTWIYRIAMNEALMRIRKNKRRPRPLEVTDEDGERREIDVADWKPRPVDRALTKELGGELDRAVALLPEDYRGAFLLRDIEGLSNEQIAKAMKLSVPAVKSRIHRARVFLRNELATYFAKGRRDN